MEEFLTRHGFCESLDDALIVPRKIAGVDGLEYVVHYRPKKARQTLAAAKVLASVSGQSVPGAENANEKSTRMGVPDFFFVLPNLSGDKPRIYISARKSNCKAIWSVPRIDYIEVLSEKDFAVYSKLRTLGKTLADREGAG